MYDKGFLITSSLTSQPPNTSIPYLPHYLPVCLPILQDPPWPTDHQLCRSLHSPKETCFRGDNLFPPGTRAGAVSKQLVGAPRWQGVVSLVVGTKNWFVCIRLSGLSVKNYMMIFNDLKSLIIVCVLIPNGWCVKGASVAISGESISPAFPTSPPIILHSVLSL